MCFYGNDREWYKIDFERRVRETPALKPDDYLFVDNPQQLKIIDDTAEEISNKAFKLQTPTAGNFRNITLQEKTVKIDEHGIPQKVSIDGVTHARKPTSTNR